MHLNDLISWTVKEDIGCNGVARHKLELLMGDNLRVGFPRNNNIGIQIAASPWQVFMLEFGIAVLPWQ